MYLVDDGGSGIVLYAIDPKSTRDNPYQGLLPDEDWPLFGGIPLGEFRVLTVGAHLADYEENLAPHQSGCGQYC